MANTKTAKENIKINERNRQRNIAYRSKMRTYIKQALQAVEAKQENAAEVVAKALRVIDKTAAKGVIKKQTAARRKSRLARFANEVAG